MYLDFDGREVRVDIGNQSYFESKHTCAKLKRLNVAIIADDQEAHEEILEIIGKLEQDGIRSTDGEGNTLCKWKITKTSYSYTPGRPERRHTLELEEIEDLRIDSLVIDELSLKPYSYHEEFDAISDALVIRAKVSCSEEQHTRLKNLIMDNYRGEVEYFSVARLGISDEPREMRFGRKMRWSKHENTIKHEVYLVEKKHDETQKRSGLFEPELSIMQNTIAAHVVSTERLLDMLVEKGVLGAEELENIKAEALESCWSRILTFYLVEDIDEWS